MHWLWSLWCSDGPLVLNPARLHLSFEENTIRCVSLTNAQITELALTNSDSILGGRCFSHMPVTKRGVHARHMLCLHCLVAPMIPVSVDLGGRKLLSASERSENIQSCRLREVLCLGGYKLSELSVAGDGTGEP